jgi:hypothetical protein
MDSSHIILSNSIADCALLTMSIRILPTLHNSLIIKLAELLAGSMTLADTSSFIFL